MTFRNNAKNVVKPESALDYNSPLKFNSNLSSSMSESLRWNSNTLYPHSLRQVYLDTSLCENRRDDLSYVFILWSLFCWCTRRKDIHCSILSKFYWIKINVFHPYSSSVNTRKCILSMSIWVQEYSRFLIPFHSECCNPFLIIWLKNVGQRNRKTYLRLEMSTCDYSIRYESVS